MDAAERMRRRQALDEAARREIEAFRAFAQSGSHSGSSNPGQQYAQPTVGYGYPLETHIQAAGYLATPHARVERRTPYQEFPVGQPMPVPYGFAPAAPPLRYGQPATMVPQNYLPSGPPWATRLYPAQPPIPPPGNPHHAPAVIGPASHGHSLHIPRHYIGYMPPAASSQADSRLTSPYAPLPLPTIPHPTGTTPEAWPDTQPLNTFRAFPSSQ